MTNEPVLWLDMDGVLADFDRAASEVLGYDSYRFEWRFGTQEFWKRLNAEEDSFWINFEPMPDMWWGLDRLHYWFDHGEVRILTALPTTNSHKCDEQKRLWVKRILGEHIPVVTCLTSEKPRYCKPGDILIDDRNKNEKAWNAAGGIFIHHHRGWLETINEMDRLRLLVPPHLIRMESY